MRLRRSDARRAAAAAAVLFEAAALLCGADDAPATVNGWVEVRPYVYLHEGSPEGQAWGRAHLSWEKRLSERLILRARGNLDLDSHGEVDRTVFYDGDDRDLRRALTGLEELSVEWTARSFDLAAGRMTIPWGRADGFNPTDNLTPFDTLDPLAVERLSSWALRARVGSGRATFEAVFLPYPGVTRLPLVGGRWLPLPERVTLYSFPGTPPTEYRTEWIDGDATYPARSTDNAAWAAKADWRGRSLEGSVSYYDGWDDQPLLSARPVGFTSGGSALEIALDRAQPTLAVTGGDLAWVRGRFVLRAEGALHDRGASGSYPADTFGFYEIEGEWTTGNWRYIGAYAGIEGAEAAVTTVSSFEQAALPAAIVHVERSVPTGFGASARLLSNLDGKGIVVQAEASWPIGASLRLGAGVDLIDGPAGSYLGAFRGNDRVRGALRWSF